MVKNPISLHSRTLAKLLPYQNLYTQLMLKLTLFYIAPFATLKIKLTPEELDFISKYRQLEELDKVKEIKMFRCLGDPPITDDDISSFKQNRVDYIDSK